MSSYLHPPLAPHDEVPGASMGGAVLLETRD